MRRPVPEWMNHLETEEDFQYPSPEEYEPSLHPAFENSDYDASFGPRDASNLSHRRRECSNSTSLDNRHAMGVAWN